MRRTPKHITTSPSTVDPGRAVFVGSPADAEAAIRAGVAVVAARTDAVPDPVRRTFDLAVPSDPPEDPGAWLDLLPGPVPAADHLGAIADRLRDGAMIGLDFDGTLSEIIDDPAAAEPVPGAIEAVTALARTHRVAIVSGRSLVDLQRRLPVSGVAWAGSHGAELVAWDGTDLSSETSEDQRGELARMRRLMERIVADLPGTEIDEKPTAIAVHTRRATDPDAFTIVSRRVALGLSRGLQALTGKEVVEVRVAGRDKGDAVAILGGDVPTMMYVGDDTTDEDALRVVRRRIGIPIVVGETVVPPSTWASLRVDDPSAVIELLAAFTAGS